MCCSSGSCSGSPSSWPKNGVAPSGGSGNSTTNKFPAKGSRHANKGGKGKGKGKFENKGKGKDKGGNVWRFFDSVSSCWKGWRKRVSTTPASSSQCSSFQPLSSTRWIPTESHQASMDHGSKLVEEKSISRPCTGKRRQRWIKWKRQQQERSKVVATSFPLAKAFERVMGGVTVKDASMLALLSAHRLSRCVYNHELREAVPPPDDTLWPILWLLAAFHPMRKFCGKTNFLLWIW